MLRKHAIKGVLGLSALAALFAVSTVQAQTAATETGNPPVRSPSKTGHAATTLPAPAGSGQAGATASGAGAPAKALAWSDRKILTDLAQSNRAEVEAARLAHSKSQNEQIRNFAQSMIDDHSKELDEIGQLAQARGVILPMELDRMHKRQIDRIASLSGDAFDRAYLDRAGVGDHQKAHNMLQKAQSNAKDADLKALVARSLPVVDQHLATVQQLHKDSARGSSKTQGSTGSSNDKKQ